MEVTRWSVSSVKYAGGYVATHISVLDQRLRCLHDGRSPFKWCMLAGRGKGFVIGGGVVFKREGGV